MRENEVEDSLSPHCIETLN